MILMDILFVHGVIAIVWLALSMILFFCCETVRDKRTMARGIFLAPFWEVVIITLVVRQIRNLWKLADWRSL